MSTNAETNRRAGLEREWWVNAVRVLRHPKAVYEAIRDEETEEGEVARQEPIFALIMLAGTAAVLNFSTTARELMDDPAIDAALVPVLAFLAGLLYGVLGYWLGGLALLLGIRGAKGETSWRESRQILGYSLAPLAASLVVWPVRLIVFGSDSFRTGGSDEGTGYWIFTAIALGFLVWSLVTLVVGVRVVYSWTSVRAIGALALTVLVMLGFGLLALVLGSG
jgi:hypothetical protein